MRRFVLIAFMLALTGCAKVLVPIERTAIFPHEKAPQLIGLCLHPPDGITGLWTPLEDDLREVEDTLEELLLSASANRRIPRQELPQWHQYFRQVGGVLRNGERMLLISYAYFPMMRDPRFVPSQELELKRAGRLYDPEWWRSQAIFVHDGGAAFFRVIYDPKRKRYVWYDQNGPE